MTTARKLTKFELVMDSFKSFCRNFIKIVDNSGDLVPFILNKEQSEFIDDFGKFSIILKARQIGWSTLICAYTLWCAIRNPNTNYLLVSLNGESASSLFEKLKSMNEHLNRDKYPFPKTDRDNKNELLLSNGSRIQVAVSDGKQIGRGATYSVIHLSEFSFYEKDQSKILTSVEQALAKNPNSKCVIETTANDTANHFYKLFMRSWKGVTNYRAYFYGWTADAYREQFRFEHDIAVQWFRDNHKGQPLHKVELDDAEQNLLEIGANLRMLMWRRWKLSSMSLQDFQQEFPSFPEEAFQNSGHNVFDQAKVLGRLQNLGLIPMRKDVLKVELPELLIPFLDKGLEIYHLPKIGKKYYGGIDVASGSGADFSTIVIMNDDGEQVAAFQHNKVSVFKFADIIDCIGRYFGYAFLCVERNSYGIPLLERLRNEKRYENLYKHRRFDQKGIRKLGLGYLTTAETKVTMITDFKEAFEIGTININCRDTLNQMVIFQEDNNKLGNKKGKDNHDDLVISHALAVQARKARKWYV